MNTLGVILSASCLAAAIAELWLRSDRAARFTAAILSVVAWATMGLIAMDQHRQAEAVEAGQTGITVPASQIIAEAMRNRWKHESRQVTQVTKGGAE